MIKLARFAYFDDRVLGKLTLKGKSWYTIEKPWLYNQAHISCIPSGVYELTRTDSQRFGPNQWEIPVQDRTGIRIHAANWSGDVSGCIGLGYGLFSDLRGIANSRDAIREWQVCTEGFETLELAVYAGPAE